MHTFRSFVTLAGAACLLAACASGESFSDHVAGASRVSGDADGVRVFQASTVADALPLAVGHCAHFQKSAQYESHDDATFKFRCVSG